MNTEGWVDLPEELIFDSVNWVNDSSGGLSSHSSEGSLILTETDSEKSENEPFKVAYRYSPVEKIWYDILDWMIRNKYPSPLNVHSFIGAIVGEKHADRLWWLPDSDQTKEIAVEEDFNPRVFWGVERTISAYSYAISMSENEYGKKSRLERYNQTEIAQSLLVEVHHNVNAEQQLPKVEKVDIDRITYHEVRSEFRDVFCERNSEDDEGFYEKEIKQSEFNVIPQICCAIQCCENYRFPDSRELHHPVSGTHD